MDSKKTAIHRSGENKEYPLNIEITSLADSNSQSNPQSTLIRKEISGIDQALSKRDRPQLKARKVNLTFESKNHEKKTPDEEQDHGGKGIKTSKNRESVSSSFKEKLTGYGIDERSSIGAHSLDYFSEFPALQSKPNNKKTYNNDSTTSNSIKQDFIYDSKEELKDEEGPKKCKGLDKSYCKSKLKTNSLLVMKKVPRAQSLLIIDLAAANESCKMKKLKSKSIAKKRKGRVKRREEPTPYCGNILDSDQPRRHKGKIRLNQKKRLTPIKAVILKRRQNWANKKMEWKSILESSRKIELTDEMVKDALILKLCNPSLEKTKCCSQIKCGGLDEEYPSDVVESDLNTGIQEVSSNNILRIHNTQTECNDSLSDLNTGIQEVSSNNILRIHNTQTECNDSLCLLDDNFNFLESQNLIPKRMIHSKRFAMYCDQWPIKEMSDAVSDLLKKLYNYQQKSQACDPFKAYSKRRFNLGLTEVTKYLKLEKIVMIIFATDIEEIDGKGGLLDAINNITKIARIQKVPFVFSSTQQKLKVLLKKNARISCIGIRNYEGADTSFKTILQLIPEAKRLYREKLEDAEKMCGVKNVEDEIDPNVAVIQSLLSKLTSFEDNEETTDSTDDTCPFLSAIMKHEQHN